MKADRKVASVDEIMDVRFGKVGTPERNLFREEAMTFHLQCKNEHKQSTVSSM
ncbi:MAG: hypothetical protein LBC75_03685 [Fibromonadaceae bacterium]|jgi:hypothetical protein|nr:hypothetical protein [Fibromonadaceae bacterium]